MRIDLSRGDARVGLPIVLAMIAIGVAMTQVASGSIAFAALAVGAALLLVVGSVAFAVVRARSAVDVVVDDGGLRIALRSGENATYVPFGAIGSLRLRGSTLRLETADGARAFVLREGHPRELGRAIESGLAARRAHDLPGALAIALARGGRPLEAWLASARGATSEGYRGGAVAPDALAALAGDRSADHELRAAAAHAVVAAGGPPARALLDQLDGRTPPLVVAAAAIATRAGTWVAPLEAALPYLAGADRADTTRLLERRSG